MTASDAEERPADKDTDAEQAHSLKQSANSLYANADYEAALALYQQALQKCPPTDTATLSALHGNIGACHLSLKSYEKAADACTQALTLVDDYHKVRHRRVRANLQRDTWKALEDAMQDLDYLKDKYDGEQKRAVIAEAAALQPRLDQLRKRETDEALGKLKQLGSGLLGKFGLSLDDFALQQDSKGGYSVNMKRS